MTIIRLPGHSPAASFDHNPTGVDPGPTAGGQWVQCGSGYRLLDPAPKVAVQRERGLRLTRVRGVPFASEVLSFDQPPDRFRVAGILGGLLQTTNSLISDTDHSFEHLALMSHVALGGFHEFQN